MCAVVYIFGNYGDITCPENTVQINSLEACERAAIFMGLNWRDSQDDPTSGWSANSGCLADMEGFSQFFDRDPMFDTLGPARLLCAVGMSFSHSRAPYRAAWYTQRTRSMPRHYRAPTAATLRRATCAAARCGTDPSILVHAPFGYRTRCAGDGGGTVPTIPASLPSACTNAELQGISEAADPSAALAALQSSSRPCFDCISACFSSDDQMNCVFDCAQ
jgi:hypothetical protein